MRCRSDKSWKPQSNNGNQCWNTRQSDTRLPGLEPPSAHRTSGRKGHWAGNLLSIVTFVKM